jgi:hypothetical protein
MDEVVTLMEEGTGGGHSYGESDRVTGGGHSYGNGQDRAWSLVEGTR